MDMTCMMPRQEKLLSVQQVVGTMVVDWLLTSYLPTRDMSSGRQPQTAYTPVLPEPNCLQADLTSISAYTGLEILSTRLLMAGMPVRRDCAHLVSGTTILQREVSILSRNSQPMALLLPATRQRQHRVFRRISWATGARRLSCSDMRMTILPTSVHL